MITPSNSLEKKAEALGLKPMRRIGYRDPETGKHYEFLTNHFALLAQTIAAIYKDRWQIELFFKSIKQNLKIKHFQSSTHNAIKTQIGIALCNNLLVQFLRFSSKTKLSFQSVWRLLQVNLFERCNIFDLVMGKPPNPDEPIDRRQLCLL